MRENEIHVRLTEYLRFVERCKSSVAEKRQTVRSLPQMEGSDAARMETFAKHAWNSVGESYIRSESLDAHEATMYWLLSVIQRPGKNEEWLSLGCGPGIHEAFLTKLFEPKKFHLLDLSAVQLEIARKVILSKFSRYVERHMTHTNASMVTLPYASKTFSQIFSLNSLHWSAEWRKGIAEIERVLCDAPSSRVYSVTSTAAVVDSSGNKTRLSQGLNSDTLVRAYESCKLVLKQMIDLTLDDGQYGLPTKRLLCVFERGETPNTDFGERMINGTISYSKISVIDGEVRTTSFNHNKS